MKIIFDGPQQVGKTTILNILKDEMKKETKIIKFPFSEVVKSHQLLQTDKFMSLLQIGKDEMLLTLSSLISDKSYNIFIDRGPMSSLYYSLTLNREININRYITMINELTKQGFVFIFIYSLNKNVMMSRNKKDKFDSLENVITDAKRDEALIKMMHFFEENSSIVFIDNDFTKPVYDNLTKLKGYIVDL